MKKITIKQTIDNYDADTDIMIDSVMAFIKTIPDKYKMEIMLVVVYSILRHNTKSCSEMIYLLNRCSQAAIDNYEQKIKESKNVKHI